MTDSKSVQHDKLMIKVNDNPAFRKWVDTVTPADQVQQVFLAEAITILSLLLKIFEMLQGAGIFTKWMTNYRTKKAMKQTNLEKRETSLRAIVK